MKSDDDVPEPPPPDTTILRIQDPDTGETVVLVLRISGGTIEAIAVEE